MGIATKATQPRAVGRGIAGGARFAKGALPLRCEPERLAASALLIAALVWPVAATLDAQSFPVPVPGPKPDSGRSPVAKPGKAGPVRVPKRPAFQPKVPVPPAGQVRAHNTTDGVVPFPAAAIAQFLDRHHAAWRKRVSERLVKEADERFRSLLPPGRYRFEGECTIHWRANAFRLNERCIRLTHADEKPGGLLLPGIDPRLYSSPVSVGPRELRGVLVLTRSGLTRRGAQLNWQVEQLTYANPFLEVLRRRFPHLPEEARLQDGYISIVLREIFSLAGSEPNRPYLPSVLEPGRRLRFDASCPLLMSRPLEEVTPAGRLWMHLRITCAPTMEMGSVRLLLPAGHAASEIAAGSRLTAELRLARIVRSGLQFRLVWDSISEIGSLPQ